MHAPTMHRLPNQLPDLDFPLLHPPAKDQQATCPMARVGDRFPPLFPQVQGQQRPQDVQANSFPEKLVVSSGVLFPHLSCWNLKLMRVSPDTGIKVLDVAGETLLTERQNATCLQEQGLAQPALSGLGQSGPHGSVWVQRDLLFCIWCLPCHLGFCRHLIFSQHPQQLELPSWQWIFGWGCFSFPSPMSWGSQGLLLGFWLPTVPPCEMLLCTSSKTLSQTFSICLDSSLGEAASMRPWQGTTISRSLRLGNWYEQSLKVKWSQSKWPQAMLVVAVLCLQCLAARQLPDLGTHLLFSSS